MTDIDYDWEYHSARVETTITSPNGRSAGEIDENWSNPQSTGVYAYARAETSLAWDWNDVDGSYTVFSRHTSDCPITDFGSTSIASLVVLHAYQREEPSGDYVPTCDSSCTYYPRYSPVGVNTPYAQCGSIKNFFTGCAVAICANQTTRGRCRG